MQSTQPSNNQLKRTKRRSLRSLIITALLLGLAIFSSLNRQYILDSYHFFTYKPTPAVAALVTKAGLSDAGTFTLYATHPAIEGSSQFNADCDHKEQGTAILGCYANDRIYVYDVEDTRLNGIQEVTAAHEMLHAVYERMSDDDRTKINALVEVEYKKLSANPAFADRMAFYARTEPGERDNELHSIIGTEVADISPELEQHYTKYFADRSKLLALFNGYNSVFTQIDSQAKSLSAQLDALSATIDSQMKAYNGSVQSLNDEIADFNRRAAGGGFTSQAAFNGERQSLQVRVDQVGTMRQTINAQVAKYEQLRTQYNDTVTTSNNLYKSIDSTLAPAPQV